MAVNAEQLLYRSPGGIGRYTTQLLTVLPACFADCEPVPVLARHPADEIESVLDRAGVSAEVRARAARQTLPRPLLYEAWLRAGWPGLRRTGPIDVVHAPSVAVPPKSAAPLVVTVHDAAPELFPDAFPKRGLAFHRRGLDAAAQRADAVITVSHAAADEIVAHSKLTVDRLWVVHNGITPPQPDPQRTGEVLRRLGLSDRPYVAWVGSLEPRKGVGTLISAMARLRRSGAHPDVHTVLAGFEGWLSEGLVDAGDRAALGDSLHQLGRLSDAELWALYEGATIFAFPSKHEGFGLPVIEAMSQGTPVVASDIPAVREVAGQAAVLVAADQPEAWAAALDALLGDEGERDRRSAAGRERSLLFSAEAMATGTRAVYQQVAS